MNKPRLTFRPGATFLHRLHPLSKIAWLVFLTIYIFIAHSVWWVLILLAVVLAVFLSLGMTLRELPGIRLFLFTAFFLALLQVVFTHQGVALAKIGSLKITDEGLTNAGYIAARFLIVIFLSYIFVLTTSPNDLAYGLMQTGLPYRFGFALVTALRFVPIFEREARMVYQAQLMRGVRYDRGSLLRLFTLARMLIFPVLVSALRKVDALAVSMDGRSFGRYPQRSYFHTVRYSGLDWLSIFFLFVLVLVAVLTTRFIGLQ